MTDESRFSRLSPERRELLKLLLEQDHLPVQPLGRPSARGRFPLSFVQERMWIAERFTPAGAYTTCIDTRGRLDAAILEKALNEIVRRHEILRTTFDPEEPVQTVHEPSSLRLALRDLRSLSESARDEETRRLLDEESSRPFDLVRGPLLRFSLCWLEEERHLVVTSIHHLIFDGWSAGVFSEELAALYEAFSRGEPSPLPALPIQYGDFALWQRDWAQSEAVRSQVSYWKRQLGGALPPLLLPKDCPPPETRTFRSASLEFQFPAELHRGVERLSREAGVTPFMTLLAAFETVLHLSTGQEDIVVGSPVANRNPVQTEKLIGCFMHPLTLRCDLSGEPSFREVLARVRKVCLEAYAHQDAPFEVVVRELRPRWDGGHLPLFQMLFNVQRARFTPARRPGFVMTPTLVIPGSALDMSVHLWTGGEAIEGVWDYSTELFDRATVEWLARGYRWVLSSVVEDADRNISTLGKWEERYKTLDSRVSKERRELAELLLADEVKVPAAIPRLPRNGDPIQASFGQERLWFFEQLETGGATFRESVALRLEGPLDVEILERSWQEVARRQESLRTSFVVEAGRLKQRIEPRVDFHVVVVDLGGLPPGEQQERVGASLEELEKPFDLSRAPLMRLVLLRLSQEEHVLLSTTHHIIADGWSGEVWQTEIKAVYDAYLEGKPSPLAELEIQYADYAVWQRERMRGPWVHEELAYWKRALGGELPALELPVDCRRAQGGGRGRGATEAFEIPKPVCEELRKLGGREGTTLFMTLLAAFQALLHRHTGEEDILVDTVLAGRNRRELEGLVGFFVNSVILRTDVSGNPTFRELLGRVRRVCLGALEHQEVPFDRVVSELGVKRNAVGGALTPVSFMLHEAAAKPFEMGGVRVSRLALEPNDEFDLTMFLWQEREGLAGQLKYDRDLFDGETIRRMAERYVRVLEEVSREPEVRVGEMEILTEEERREVLGEWNETEEEVGEKECVHERFESTVEERGSGIAVRLSGGMREEGKEYELSYEELEGRANRLARSLRKRGVRAETRVGLCVGRSLELMVGMLGILKSGGAYVPLDVSQPRERLKKVMEDSGVGVVVTREEEREKLAELLAGLVVVEVEETRGESGERVESGVRGGNAAYVVYTSGTTGEPKGVVVSHGSVVNHNVSVSRRFGLRATDRVLQFHTVSFDAAVEEIYPTWMTGGTVVMRGEELLLPGEELERVIEEEELTVLNLPTAYWQEWVLEGERRKGIAVSGLRLVVVGGDKASAERYGRWRELSGGGVRFVNTYGPTETTVVSSLYEAEGADSGEVSGGMSIGRPIGNTRMYVLDSGMEPVPAGVGGELWVGGKGVARGYLGRAEQTAERFVADPFAGEGGARMYRTGDRVRYLRDGRVEFLGRVDEQVKIRGFRVEPAEVESVLLKHPAVDRAVVTAWKPSSSETRLAAYVVPFTEANPAVGDEPRTALVPRLRDYLQNELPAYMLPSAIVLVDSLPMTAGGKLDRRALPEPELVPLERTGARAPRTPTEEVLAEIWADVLGLQRVGIDDNFFELGGHSLKASELVHRIRESFSADLPLRTVFESPTVALIAPSVDAAVASGAGFAIPGVEVAPRDGPVPLSYAQEGAWWVDRLEPGIPFNIPVVLRLEGDLRMEILEWALNEVVRRHEVLRTNFSSIDGEPFQLIAEHRAMSVPCLDLTALPDPSRKDTLLEGLTRIARTRFDLSQGPLLRMAVFRLAERDHVLIFTVHHSVFDGWSSTVFAREMAELYASMVRGGSSGLAPLPVQYADYAAWQRNLLRGEFVESQVDYWKAKLDGAPSELNLPIDSRSSNERLFRGGSLDFVLPPALSESLRSLGRGEGVTLFMLLLAAFKCLLARHTGQEDLVVGTPVANRSQVETQSMIGFCVNLLALRTDLAENPSFRALVKRVRDTCLGAFAHQELPFGLLVRRLAPLRDVSRSPIFQAQFALYPVRRGAFELPGLRISSAAETPLLGASLSRLLVDATPANDPLFLHMVDSGEELRGVFHYRADLFDGETIRRMAERYVRVLEEVSREPEVRVGEMGILTEEERREVLGEWNETEEEVGEKECVHERFESTVAERGSGIAVRLSGGMREEGKEYELSYEELEGRANRLARSLRKRGVRAETRVGLCVGRSLELMVGMLGILKSGGAYVPLDVSQPRERLKKVMEDSGVGVVVTREEEREKLAELLAGLVVVEVEQTRGESGERVESGVRGGNAAYVVYTSGTTGEPKGVVVSHGSVVNHNVSVSRRFGLRATDRVLQFHTVSFDAAVEEIYPTWMTGGTVVMRGEELLLPGEELERVIEEEELTVLNLPTAYWQEWVLEGERRKGIAVSGLRLVVVGGDKASAERYGRWRELSGGGVRFVNTYGPTETTVVSSLYEAEGADSGEVSGGMSIGRPIGNTRMYVLDSGMEPVPVGVGGELWVGGKGVARGYLGRAEQTAERFVADPFAVEGGARMYRTGDRVRYLRDGRVEFLGRVDEQVKIRGFRVEPAEIEIALKRHRGVLDAVVLPIEAKENRHEEKRLFAFVIATEGERVAAGDLREFLNERIPPYMVPAGFVFVDRFPTTAVGKIDRLALARRAEVGRASEEIYVAPRTSTETELAGIWSELLGLERIGIHDDFFALGGHSLLAAKALARVRSRFQVELSLRELFLHPTIAGVALATDLALATGASAPMTELDLERETELDEVIRAEGGNFQFPAHPSRVFLTGATGFVGAYLLRELLDALDAEVLCLVRAASPDDGAAKLRHSLEKYGLWNEAAGARIVPVPGDLSEPRFGLSDEHYAGLGRDVGVIYHNGAWVNTLYPYAMLKAANVLGTEEVLRLACHTRLKPVHYVSTLSVFPPERWASGVMDERWLADGGNSLHGGYAQSKWVAERLVSAAARRGIPVSTYRLGRVSGDSRTGVWIPDPMLIEFLQTILDVGSLPRVDDGLPIDLVPVDYVTRAMVCLSRQSESLGKIFHLVNPEPVTWRDFVDRLRRSGSPLRELSPEQWGAELLRFARRNPDNFLHPLVPLLPSDVAARLESESEPVPERRASPGNRAAIAGRVDCTNTLQGLKDSELTCPPGGALLDMYFSYFVRSGMLTLSG